MFIEVGELSKSKLFMRGKNMIPIMEVEEFRPFRTSRTWSLSLSKDWN